MIGKKWQCATVRYTACTYCTVPCTCTRTDSTVWPLKMLKCFGIRATYSSERFGGGRCTTLHTACLYSSESRCLGQCYDHASTRYPCAFRGAFGGCKILIHSRRRRLHFSGPGGKHTRLVDTDTYIDYDESTR